ncbi:MAG: RNA polymerase sigma-70 factor [Chitinophagaceae bacterium]|nr:RNA polymerase sigma-70 factor [Chitinophagaceae bacterium]
MIPTEKYREPELLKNISDGDEEAFAVFFRNHYPHLKRAVSRFFTNSMEVEDVLQETFIKVWLNRDRLPEIENITSWLHTIASRTCLNQIEKNLTREKYRSAQKDSGLSSSEVPFERVTAREISRLVAEAVQKMPAARKKIYSMSREDGMKPAQIAEMLSLSVNTVRNVLVAALKEIREYLSANGHIVSFLCIPAFLYFISF